MISPGCGRRAPRSCCATSAAGRTWPGGATRSRLTEQRGAAADSPTVTGLLWLNIQAWLPRRGTAGVRLIQSSDGIQ